MKQILMVLVLSLVLIPLFAQSEVVYEKRESFTVVGLQILNTMDQTEMINLWGRFMAIKDSIPNRIDDEMFGLSFYTRELGPDGEPGYGYMAAVAVRELGELPAGCLAREIPASTYAVFTHQGLATTMSKTYEYIFGQWFRENRVRPRMQDTLEVYREDYNPESVESRVYIWVPIEQ